MMNLLALAYVASCLTGLVVVVPPEPLDIHKQPASSYEGSHLLHSAKQAAKQAAQHVLCDQPPCPPTALDNLKDTLHHSYQKTADSFEGAKDFVSNSIEAAKESAEGAYHHVQDSIHSTADRAKNGIQDTVEKAKDGMHDTVEKAKHGARATADKAASFIPGKDKKGRDALHAESDDPALYIMPGVSKTMESLKRTFDEEKHEIFTLIKGSPAMETLKRKAEQASGYIPSGRQVEDSVEGVKQGVKETASGMQDKASDMLGGASDMARGVRGKAGNLIGDAGSMFTRKGEYKDKVGSLLHGIKEKLIHRTHDAEEDDEGLEMKVHELCSIVGADQTKAESGTHTVDTEALRESYGYLMESAIRAIDSAKEMFEKAIEGEGTEWKEKYIYLADSAKGALEGAKDVFDRAVTTIEDDIIQRQKEAAAAAAADDDDDDDHVRGKVSAKRHLTSRLKEVAGRTKQTVRSLVRTFYLASFSIAFGVTLWTTFFSGHLLSQALARQQLALVQSKLFPVYLRVITGCLVVCAIAHMALHPWPSASRWEHLQNWNFSFTLVISLFNTLLLEPKVTKVMFEKLRIEKEEGRGQSGDSRDEATQTRSPTPVDTKFKGLHQIASFANLVVIAGLTWHLWYLAHRLVV